MWHSLSTLSTFTPTKRKFCPKVMTIEKAVIGLMLWQGIVLVFSSVRSGVS